MQYGAEEPLPAGGSCLLGSLNLSEFVKCGQIDWDDLKASTITAVNALNDVLLEGLYLHPLKEQQESVKLWRQIGLGTMGLADMLIKLKLTYGSPKSISVIKEVYKTIAQAAVEASLQSAKLVGAYPACNKDLLVKSAFIKALDLPDSVLEEIKQYGLFNSQLLTCAPTGSIGTMFQTSTGVEPIFAMKYTRTTKSLEGHDVVFDVYTKIAEDWIKENPGKQLPDYFIESKDITPEQRVIVQAQLQQYIDASISSTCNLPNTATVDDVYTIYMQAWKSGCKGFTTYRAGCKRDGILNTTETKQPDKNQETDNPTLKRGFIIKASDNCIGLKRTLVTGCGTLHCEAFFDPDSGDLLETYLSKGSKGGCNNFMIGLSRMISLSARGGIKLENILDQLKSCGTCPSYAVRTAINKDTSLGSCCPVSVGNALKDMHAEVLDRITNCANKYLPKDFNNKSSVIDTQPLEECPECHHKTLLRTSGCMQCVDCGYSKCD